MNPILAATTAAGFDGRPLIVAAAAVLAIALGFWLYFDFDEAGLGAAFGAAGVTALGVTRGGEWWLLVPLAWIGGAAAIYLLDYSHYRYGALPAESVVKAAAFSAAGVGLAVAVTLFALHM